MASTKDGPEGIETENKKSNVIEWIKRQILQFLRYFQLLVAAEPTKWDIFMLALGVISAIAAGVPFPLLAIIFGQLVDDFNTVTCDTTSDNPGTHQNGVNNKVLLLFYIAIAQFVLMYTYLACWNLFGARLAQRLRQQYLTNLLNKQPSFFDTRPAGEVSSRLNGDIQTIRAGTSEKVGLVISSVSFFVTAYVVAFIKEPKLAAMLLSLVPAYFLMSLVGNKYIEKYAGSMSDHVAKASSVALESLSNIMVVQAFSARTRLGSNFSGHLDKARKDGVKKAIAVGIQAGLMYFIAYSAQALAFWQGSRSIAGSIEGDGAATVGRTYTVIFVLGDATLVLSQVAPFVQIFSAAVGAAISLLRDMEFTSKKEKTIDESPLLSPEVIGSISFNDVSFEYPSRPGASVLEHVSLEFPAGKHTAIVGQSGSGKSTIAELVSKLYLPTIGNILIDGHDLQQVDSAHLRSHIGFVEQDPTLLNRSLLENIALGLLNSSLSEHSHLKTLLLSSMLQDYTAALRDNDTERAIRLKSSDSDLHNIIKIVEAAAGLADADVFIRQLKYGYATTVGNKGRSLSGGQKQRIALARALVRNPRILIQDEATSALDSQTESRVQESLKSVYTGRTTITIAHRLASIREADNIIVMNQGKIVEQGTHVELVAKQGAYADMVNMQVLRSPTFSDDSKTLSISSSSSRLNEAYKEKKVIESTEISEPVSEEVDTAISSERSLGSISVGVWRWIRQYALILLGAFVGSIIVGGSFSAESVIFGNTVGHLNTCRSPSQIRSSGNFFGLMFFTLGIIEFFANVISWSGFGYVAEKLVCNVRISSFNTLLIQNLDWHHADRRSPSSLLSLITKDGNALAGISGSVIGTILSIIINLIAAVILTTVVAWKIALVCLATVPLLLGAGVVQLKVLAKFEEQHETAYTESVDIAIEAVESIKTVATFSLEEDTVSRYRRALNGPRKELVKVSLSASLWQAITFFIGNLSYALAFWWGSKQIITGTYTPTQFLIVVMSLLISAQLWTQMFALAPELTSARAAIARLLNLLDLQTDEAKDKSFPGLSPEKLFNVKDLEKTAESAIPSIKPNGGMAINFENVSFAYSSQSDVPVLSNLNIHIPAGKFCALVGPSGAGKSTIISLMERLYMPTSGKIEVGGLDITQFRETTFRDNIALVPQGSALFEGSVRFNVSLGARPGYVATDAEIEEACKLANIHETITSLPQGYNTDCGSNGGLLSGGQRQRISIARALVRKPQLLILDESTSALDVQSEKAIQDSLKIVAGGVTIVAIAHRLNTIQNADIIFVIEGGRCSDQGNHKELMERNETYRTSALHQQLG